MPDVTSGWGRLTWGQANWNEATTLKVGWGAKSWGEDEWGELKDAVVVDPTGVSFSASIGSVSTAVSVTAEVTGLSSTFSDIAERKFPPIARNTLPLPSIIARAALTAS